MLNIKLRAKNPTYWVSLVVTVGVGVFATLGVDAKELTTWSKVGEMLVDIVSNPYLLVTIIVTAVTQMIDYTTKGVKDSGHTREQTKVRNPKKSDEAIGFLPVIEQYQEDDTSDPVFHESKNTGGIANDSEQN